MEKITIKIIIYKKNYGSYLNRFIKLKSWQLAFFKIDTIK